MELKLKKSKQIPFGMIFLSLAIISNKLLNINDFAVGILYGISLALLIIGIFSKRK